MSNPKVLAFILAGGKGERLFPLTSFRSKPSIPFGGRYRIVDFVLSNLVNSQIYSIYMLVQYKSQSLIEHVRQNWILSSVIKDHFVTVVPPQMRMGPEWFQGTADAVFQNIGLIRDHNPDLVVVFGADHIYRMDIRQMINFHLTKGASVTVAARPVPIDQASAFGVIQTDPDHRITGFQEKPKRPSPMPGDPAKAYVSMGNYVFSREVLLSSLADAQRKKQHDFGAHVIPSLVGKGRVFTYDFATNVIPGASVYEEPGYWRDVGTIPAYFEAHRDLLGKKPKFELDNGSWPIHSSGGYGPSAKFLRAEIRNSIIADGVVINKAKIKNSVIRSGVQIEDNVVVEDSIVMDKVVLRRNCRIKNVIIDKLNVIDEGEEIGFDPKADLFKCHIDKSGIGIVPKAGRKRKPRQG
ncbi:MAG: glucose-1-phosphate adenylyltransferase [Nitrospirae bacterium]|nr:glucose-1-phosphate adenylyltransferase [Nitrospirota bacterium]